MSKGRKTANVDMNTGEIMGYGRWKSDAQILAEIKYAKKQRIKEQQQSTVERIKDKFIWSYFEEQKKMFPELKPQDISRLIYIATYCDYNDNILKIKGKLIDNIKLKNIMMLSDPQYYNWYKLMIKLGYIEKIEDKYKLNSNFFSKGGLIQNGNTTRIFINTIRNLYENLKCTDHYKLGYLLQLIPYINPYNNALVENISEKDPNKLKPLKLSYLANILGYSKKNIKKLANELLSIKYGEKQIPLIGLLALNSLNVENMFIIINSKLFFGGNVDQYNNILEMFENNTIESIEGN